MSDVSGVSVLPWARLYVRGTLLPARHLEGSAVSRVAQELARLWSGGGSSATQDASLERLELIEDLITVDDVVRIEAFLRQHPALLDLLLELRSRAGEVFGEELQVSLQLLEEPDNENEELELFALVRSAAPLEERLRHLRRLDESWWRDAASRAAGLLNVDVDLS